MIDIHTHILPNISNDDGPKDIEKSLSMIERAYQDGVRKIVATPHLLSQIENRKTEIKEAIDLLNSKQNLIELIIGSEIFADDSVLQNKNDLITLGDGNYLLIEFTRAELPYNVEEIFFQLQTKGFECIFAHPERNGTIINNPNRLLSIINAGVLCQVNAGSLLGRYGKESQKTVEILLEHQMAHFIASDMHSPKNRYYSLKEAVTNASKFTDHALDLVTTNPEIILQRDGFLEIYEPKEYRKKGFWFFRR